MRVETIGNATLYLGDCREILPTLPKVDACITDPPYGIDFAHAGNDNGGIGNGRYATKFAGEKIIGDAIPFDPIFICELNIPTILWGGNHFATRLQASPCWLIWDKRAASGHTNDFADCEIAWANFGGVARIFRHHWDGMMKASERGEPRCHPTQKPIALMSWCISQIKSNPKTILDPFMGSGTTGVAAVQLGRKFIGIEIDKRYFDIACTRIENAQRQTSLFEPQPAAKPVNANLLAEAK